MYIDEDGNVWLKISELHSQAYCEYQLKYAWQGIDIKTEQMIIGSARHKELEDKHTERMKDAPKMSMEEALRLGVKGSGRELRVRSEEHFLLGFIDEVQFQPDAVYVIDDKPDKKIYRSAMNQARAYSLCVSSIYSEYVKDKKIFSVIRNRDSGEVIWNEEFTENPRKDVMEVIERLRKLAKEEIDFIPTKFPNKCRPCRFNKICDKSLI
jgi:CRISPR-associated exonuclease Cas4